MQLFIRFVIAIIMCPFFVAAHEYWIETSGTHKAGEPATIRMYFGEYALGSRLSGKSLDKMKDIQVYVATPDGKKQQVEMKQLSGYWEGIFLPQKEGQYQVTGINDEREVQDWTKHNLGITRPIQYLKSVYNVGDSHSQHQFPVFLDVITTYKSKGKYVFTVVKDGIALPAQKMTIASFGGAEQNYTTNSSGKAKVILKNPGIYLVSIDWIDTAPGTFKQKDYETVRHRLDFTLEHQ